MRSTFFFALATCGALLAGSRTTSAASIIRDPNPPKYSVEIEPHLDVSFIGFVEYGTGFGPGARFSIPVMSPGFIKTINDSIAISFGADLLRYNAHGYRCTSFGCNDQTFWTLYFPVALQWNFWLTDSWSVFGEPGFAFRQVADCGEFGCPNKSRFYGAFYAGARYHFSDTLALTLRAGYPTGFSVGLSIF